MPRPVTQMESSPAPVSTRAAPLVTITSLPAVPIKVIPGSPVWVGVNPLHSAAPSSRTSSARAGPAHEPLRAAVAASSRAPRTAPLRVASA